MTIKLPLDFDLDSLFQHISKDCDIVRSISNTTQSIMNSVGVLCTVSSSSVTRKEWKDSNVDLRQVTPDFVRSTANSKAVDQYLMNQVSKLVCRELCKEIAINSRNLFRMHYLRDDLNTVIHSLSKHIALMSRSDLRYGILASGEAYYDLMKMNSHGELSPQIEFVKEVEIHCEDTMICVMTQKMDFETSFTVHPGHDSPFAVAQITPIVNPSALKIELELQQLHT